MERFPSGQREQTVNLSSLTSMVRIHLSPPKQLKSSDLGCFFIKFLHFCVFAVVIALEPTEKAVFQPFFLTDRIVLNVLKARLTRQKPIYYRKNGFERHYHRLTSPLLLHTPTEKTMNNKKDEQFCPSDTSTNH